MSRGKSRVESETHSGVTLPLGVEDAIGIGVVIASAEERTLDYGLWTIDYGHWTRRSAV